MEVRAGLSHARLGGSGETASETLVMGVASVHPNPPGVVMAEKKEPKQGWAGRRREKKRLKLERTGPSPQAQGERRKGGPPTVKDNANQAGMGGFVSGGF
jgi:hypothetical protein